MSASPVSEHDDAAAAASQPSPETSFGPAQEDIARALVPHLERAQACLTVAIAVAKHGEEGLNPLIATLILLKGHYMAGVDALQALNDAVPCRGTA